MQTFQEEEPEKYCQKYNWKCVTKINVENANLDSLVKVK
jgi:hypothetical protein